MSINTPLIQSIRHCVFPKYQSVTVALSGGVDSVVMLHACIQLRTHFPNDSFKLSAIHVHHGLSPNADAWLAFCQDLCEKHHIEFTFKKITLNKQSRESLEELARNTRYKAIDELVSPNSLVLLAQHEDDQAETVLLQLKRGAGPKGLSGMAREFSKSSALKYARPWVSAGISKQDILSYAKQYELSWFEDESNQDVAFERNFIRNEVLPILRNKWPQIAKTISRSADLCAVQNELVESFATQALYKISTDTGTLSIDGLRALPNSLAAEALRMWTFKRSNINPSHAQLKEIEKLCEAKVDQTGLIQLGQWQCRRFNHSLYWVDGSEVVTEPYPPFEIDVKALKNSRIQYENISIHILSAGQEEIKQTDALSYIAVSENVETIKIIYGDLQRKIKMYANRPTKTVKAWMKEWQIEPWRRMAMPMLLIADEVFAIVTDRSVYVRDIFAQPDGSGKPITLVIKNGKPLPDAVN